MQSYNVLYTVFDFIFLHAILTLFLAIVGGVHYSIALGVAIAPAYPLTLTLYEFRRTNKTHDIIGN